MNYFVSFTGKNFENHVAIGEYMDAVTGSLLALGHSAITMYSKFDDPVGSPQVTFTNTMHQAFQLMDTSDRLLCLMQQATPGYGMLMEMGYAHARDMPIVMATHDAAGGHYLEDFARINLVYRNSADLGQKIHLLTDEIT